LATTSIGKFQVVGRLGRGGMAEIYVCRLQGIGGFDKEVVVKRIIAERAGDPQFVQMFLDEARMVANLNHPNIVQVYEIGEEAGAPFMVMEYVKGVTLGMIIRESHKQKKVHLGHAVAIIEGVADALDYAHNARGTDGQPLGLVHRDVSPGNIVVSREGIPKLLDFGVARARGRLSQTDAGTLKGKVRYMAPEQVSQGPLDQRADIFSLGICLFELTTGSHPFGPPGGSDVAVLRNIVNGVFANPSDLVPNYPRALEQIVLSAIEQDVNKRCSSARELRERLESFLVATRYGSSRRELVPWMRTLFPDFSSLTKTGGLTAFTMGTPSGGQPITPTPTNATASLGPIPTHLSGASWPAVQESDWQPPALGPADTTKLNTEPRSLSRRLLAAKWPMAVGAAVALLAASLVVFRVGPFASRPPLPVLGPSPTGGSDDDAALAYLDAAEKLARERHFEPALDMLSKAGELKIKRPDLNIRLTNLRYTVATAAVLRQARAAAEDKDWRAALAAGRTVLGRDPENAEAKQIVATARTALEPHGAERVAVAARPPGRARPTGTRAEAPGRGGRPTVALAQGAGSERPDPPGREAAIGEAPAPTLKVAQAPVPAAPRLDPAPESRMVVRSAPSAPDSSTPAGPALPAAAAARPASATPPAHPASGGLVHSAFSKSSIPKPTLPRSFVAQNPEQLARGCQLVESALVSDAGLDPAFARGITGPFRRALPNNAQVYPVAMYYFLVREAALQRDNRAAAADLAAAQTSGTLIKFRDLPAFERPL
jgi:serine/threonine protein kinase